MCVVVTELIEGSFKIRVYQTTSVVLTGGRVVISVVKPLAVTDINHLFKQVVGVRPISVRSNKDGPITRVERVRCVIVLFYSSVKLNQTEIFFYVLGVLSSA